MEFLFNKYEESQENMIDSDYQLVMNDKIIADNNVLKVSLA